MLDAREVSLSINGKRIFDNISLGLQPGTFTAVLGANGAGKSSLLRTMCGDSSPSEGEVRIGDKSLHEQKPAELATKRAVMSQQFSVNFPFKVEEIVAMGRMPHLADPETDSRIVEDALKLTDTARLRKRPFTSLSGGEQQRVQLARVLAQIYGNGEGSKYLFLDEPTSNMDLAQQQRILETVKDIQGENIAVMAVIHDLNAASRFADKILFLKNGKEIAQGITDEVFTKETIEETYSHPVRMLRCPETRCPFVIADSAKISQIPINK
ncbi:hemin import ATP-binding protein HmuV [Fulvitalea axinellae]|uniref:Hemin import ATP-binding protein HmuV n=1 Tax=Fulvitalea axinellae TaxID=1182444 RepID=A0AAU9CPZ2_9BACT|nr:hemin import ATP-binding protein HmuV [Fulvitalea axinellae]